MEHGVEVAPIPDFPFYFVTKDGRVWSAKTKTFLIPEHNVKGYLRVRLYNQQYRKGKRFFIHRLVALTWIPNPENKPEVNHIDEYIFNNTVNNLEWVTKSENAQHSKKLMTERLKQETPF